MTAIVETDGDTHIYRPNHAHVQAGRIAGVGFGIVASVMIGLIMVSNVRTTGQPPRIDELIPLIFLGVVLVFVLRPGAELPYRLVISPRGIEYHDTELSLVSTWDNVKELRTMYQSTLVLDRPSATRRRSLSYQPNVTRHIPLDIFDYDPYSAIAQDLRTYAPHLFKADPPRRVRADVDDDDAWL